jgi:hypothetical protein
MYHVQGFNLVNESQHELQLTLGVIVQGGRKLDLFRDFFVQNLEQFAFSPDYGWPMLSSGDQVVAVVRGGQAQMLLRTMAVSLEPHVYSGKNFSRILLPGSPITIRM